METKANYLMIGGFVLGVLALAFIFVFWMSNFAGGGKRYYIVFDSSVAGLTTGSSVGFNGIKVGEVQSFALDPAGRPQSPGADQRARRHAGARELACQHAVDGADRRQRRADHRRARRIRPSWWPRPRPRFR